MKKLILILALLTVWVLPAQAQTAITTTTITEPVTTASPTSITLTVAATTGMTVNGILWLDGSVYRIRAINGLNVQVINQYRPSTHLDNATVWVVPVGAQVGLDPVGSCIRGTAGTFPAYSPYTLMFNLQNGNMWGCRGALGSRVWGGTNQYQPVPSNVPPQTP